MLEYFVKFVSAIAALCIVSFSASAQINDDFVNQEITTGQLYTQVFNVTAPLNTLITGSTTPVSGVTGSVIVTSLTTGQIVAEDLNFAAGDLTGNNYDFKFNNLAAGSYLLGYQFTSPTSAVDNVGFAASTLSTPKMMAPEIHGDGAAAALTTLAFAIFWITGNKRKSVDNTTLATS